MKQKVEQRFNLENFDGPLDLLLHLVRVKKLDLLEISLVEVADQFLDLVMKQKDTQNFDLDEISEYLLIASQLVSMKSKHLLKTDIFAEKSDYEVLDEENLLDRLLIYEKFKTVSESIMKLYEQSSRYEKLDNEYINYLETESEKSIKILSNGNEDFMRAWNNIFERAKSIKPKTKHIYRKRMSIEDRKNIIDSRLEELGNTTFLSIMGDDQSIYLFAITILILLEMANQGFIQLKQREDFKDIYIIQGEENETNKTKQQIN